MEEIPPPPATSPILPWAGAVVVITRRPGAGEGRTVRLDLGGAAADEGSDWRGAQGAAADGRAKRAAGAAQGGEADLRGKKE